MAGTQQATGQVQRAEWSKEASQADFPNLGSLGQSQKAETAQPRMETSRAGPSLIPFLPSGTPGGSPEAQARWERWPPAALLGTDGVLQQGQRGAWQRPQGQLSPLEAWGHPSIILSLWELQGAAGHCDSTTASWGEGAALSLSPLPPVGTGSGSCTLTTLGPRLSGERRVWRQEWGPSY